MTQPGCDGLAVLPSVQTVPLVAGPPEPAAWAWLIILGGLIGFELWAILTHHHTLSQWLQGQGGKHAWLRWLGLGAFLVLIWHLFFA